MQVRDRGKSGVYRVGTKGRKERKGRKEKEEEKKKRTEGKDERKEVNLSHIV